MGAITLAAAALITESGWDGLLGWGPLFLGVIAAVAAIATPRRGGR